jgi:hypothetical protein
MTTASLNERGKPWQRKIKDWIDSGIQMKHSNTRESGRRMVLVSLACNIAVLQLQVFGALVLYLGGTDGDDATLQGVPGEMSFHLLLCLFVSFILPITIANLVSQSTDIELGRIPAYALVCPSFTYQPVLFVFDRGIIMAEWARSMKAVDRPLVGCLGV